MIGEQNSIGIHPLSGNWRGTALRLQCDNAVIELGGSSLIVESTDGTIIAKDGNGTKLIIPFGRLLDVQYSAPQKKRSGEITIRYIAKNSNWDDIKRRLVVKYGIKTSADVDEQMLQLKKGLIFLVWDTWCIKEARLQEEPPCADLLAFCAY